MSPDDPVFFERGKPTYQRHLAIQIVKSLYPPDSGDNQTAAVGQRLLEAARREVKVKSWQNEPTQVLVRLAQLCQEEEKKIAP